MTADSNLQFRELRQHNLKTMRRELYRLKKEYEELFNEWLKIRGNYTTDARVAWFKFKEKAEQYKALNFKMQEIERGLKK